MSHQDETVVTYFAKELGRCSKDKLKIKRGRVFDHLGMDVGFESCPGMLSISIFKYLSAMIEKWSKELKGHKVTSLGDKRELLPKETASQSRRTTAQPLFMCLRDRPDVQTSVSFFTTRVRSPSTDDRKKLWHCMLYLKSTLHMKRYLSADNLTNLLWWVNGSYGVCWDSKGHTGAMMFVGRGAIAKVSHRHKLNVRSSTES